MAAGSNDDDSDWGSSANERNKANFNKKSKASSITDDSDDNDDDDHHHEDARAHAKPETERVEQVPKEKHQDSEPEEGQLTSDDDNDDSDDSDSSSSSEFNDGFDENLMGDAEDRARLEALTEKERETEIFKRIERRDMMKTRWEIERKLKMAKRSELGKERKPKTKKKKKEKKIPKAPEIQRQRFMSPRPEITTSSSPPPSSQTLSDSPEKKSDQVGSGTEYFDPKERSKERKKNVEANKTNDKRSDAMALLKARREGRQKREEEEAKKEAQRKIDEEKEEIEGVSGGKSAVKLKASDIYSDDSGSSSSDEEKASDKRSTASSKSSSESEDEEKVEKKIVHISTNAELNKLRLSRYKMERFINLPHFDRVVLNCFVRVSIGNHQGRPVYRAGEIVGVVETAKVYSFGKGRTNKGLRLRHGTQERVFRLEFISNQDFSDIEFDKWKHACESQNVPLPTTDMIEQKAKDVKEALTYEYKEEDIHKLLREKDRFRAHPTNYAMKKTQLIKDREAAIMRGEEDIARELSIQIQELEERANELDKKRSSSISLISYINNRNRKRNVEDAEKAIMEEAKANRGVKIEDPFTRRSTQPTMSFAKKKDEVEALPMQLPPPPPLPAGARKKAEDKKANGPITDNNLYSLHDFEIDLDVPLPISSVVAPKPVEKVKESGPKRSLNLEDYKKKRGLI